MPFLPAKKTEEEEINKNNNISGVTNSFNIQNTSNGLSSGKSGKKSGSWVNLNSYLDANKEQAGGMADKLTSDIDSSAQDADNKLNQVKTSAPTGIQSINSQQIKDNYFATPDESKKTEYQALKSTGGYNGPSDIYGVAGYGDAEAQAKKADQRLQQSKSESGRQELLKESYKRPNYTQGQNVLDNLLVQNDAGSKQKFQNVQNKWAGLNQFLGDTTSGINNTIQDNLSKAQANKSLLPQVEDEYVNEFLNPLQQRAVAANTNNPVIAQRILDDASDSTLSDESLSMLGLNEGEDIYGLNLRDYINPDLTEVKADNVASQEERAKYQALMNLMNRDATAISKDGKSISPVGFNKDAFTTAQSAAANESKDIYENRSRNQGGSFYTTEIQKTKPVLGIGDGVRAQTLNSMSAKELQQALDSGSILNMEGFGVGAADPNVALDKYRNLLQPWINQMSGSNKIKRG